MLGGMFGGGSMMQMMAMKSMFGGGDSMGGMDFGDMFDFGGMFGSEEKAAPAPKKRGPKKPPVKKK